MASKKTFTNPAEAFLSKETIERVTDARAVDSPPPGYKMNPAYIETKSRRVQLLLQPTIYNAIKERAEADGQSVNEAIAEAIKAYTGGKK